MWATPTNGSRWCSQSEWNGDTARYDQLVVAAVVGKRSGVEGSGGEQLAVEDGDPARRLTQALLLQVNAEGLEQPGGSPLRCGAVDARSV